MTRKELIAEIIANSTTENVFQKCPYTCVVLSYDYDATRFYGTGFSKVNWPDKFDEYTGENLAFSRAIGDIVKQIRQREKDKELDKVEKLVEFYTSI